MKARSGLRTRIQRPLTSNVKKSGKIGEWWETMNIY